MVQRLRTVGRWSNGKWSTLNRLAVYRMILEFTSRLFRYSESFLFLFVLQGSLHTLASTLFTFLVLMVKFKMTSPQISFHGWLFISILGLTAFVAMRFLYHFHAILDRIHAGFCHLHSSISGQNKYSELGCEQSPCALTIRWERCATSIFSDAERREMIEHNWEKHYWWFRCKISVFLWRQLSMLPV